MITPSFAPTATERVLPKLALDFTTASLDPRITFTRVGSTATRVNASGYIETVNADTPRFDYDPITLACKGLLIEEARGNNLAFSIDFGGSSWNPINVSVSTNQINSPDGTQNADKIIENTANGEHMMRQAPQGLSANTVYTTSIYVKPNGRDTFIRILDLDNVANGYGAAFDLTNGTTSGGTAYGSATFSGSTITNAGNGWWRISISGNGGATCTKYVIDFYCRNNGQNVYTGNGSSGIYLWGAQLEAGSFATSFIQTTTTTPVTRNADVATMTGTNFSDWWQASKSGVLVRARPGTVSGTRPWVQFDDGTANEIIALRGNTTNPELYIVDGGVAQAQIDAGTIAANNDYSLTGWWATNDCKARLDSGAVVTDTSATIPTVTQARLGSDGTNYLNGHLASISYYDSFSEQVYTRRKNKAVLNLM